MIIEKIKQIQRNFADGFNLKLEEISLDNVVITVKMKEQQIDNVITSFTVFGTRHFKGGTFEKAEDKEVYCDVSEDANEYEEVLKELLLIEAGDITIPGIDGYPLFAISSRTHLLVKGEEFNSLKGVLMDKKFYTEAFVTIHYEFKEAKTASDIQKMLKNNRKGISVDLEDIAIKRIL